MTIINITKATLTISEHNDIHNIIKKQIIHTWSIKVAQLTTCCILHGDILPIINRAWNSSIPYNRLAKNAFTFRLMRDAVSRTKHASYCWLDIHSRTNQRSSVVRRYAQYWACTTIVNAEVKLADYSRHSYYSRRGNAIEN